MRPTAALLLALLAGCAALPALPPAPSAPPPAGAGTSAGSVEEFVGALDRHRARVGCPALLWDEEVARVARSHSADMQRRGYFAHTTPEGRTLRDRLAAGGLQGQVGWGENIARYPRGGRALLEFWLESPGHRENLETCAYTHHGLGGAGEYWTHVFLTRRPAR